MARERNKSENRKRKPKRKRKEKMEIFTNRTPHRVYFSFIQ